MSVIEGLLIQADPASLSFKGKSRRIHVAKGQGKSYPTNKKQACSFLLYDSSLTLPLADDTACEDAFEPKDSFSGEGKGRSGAIPNPYPTRSTAFYSLSALCTLSHFLSRSASVIHHAMSMLSS